MSFILQLASLGMFTWWWHLYKVVNRPFPVTKFSSKEKEETTPYNLPSCATSPDKLMIRRGCHAYHGFLAPQNHLVQLSFLSLLPARKLTAKKDKGFVQRDTDFLRDIQIFLRQILCNTLHRLWMLLLPSIPRLQ